MWNKISIIFCFCIMTQLSSFSLKADIRHPLGLNIAEYPDDDYSHVVGINNIKQKGISSSSHSPTKLQTICRIRLDDVERMKLPIDTDGCGIDRSMYISTDDFIDEISDWDDKYGKPLNLKDKIISQHP